MPLHLITMTQSGQHIIFFSALTPHTWWRINYGLWWTLDGNTFHWTYSWTSICIKILHEMNPSWKCYFQKYCTAHRYCWKLLLHIYLLASHYLVVSANVLFKQSLKYFFLLSLINSWSCSFNLFSFTLSLCKNIFANAESLFRGNIGVWYSFSTILQFHITCCFCPVTKKFKKKNI